MKTKKLFQSEEEPQSHCIPSFFSNSGKNKSIFLGYWHKLATLLFTLLLFGNGSWAQPAIDGVAAEWPAAFNGGSVLAKTYVRDADSSNDSQFATGSHDTDPISGSGGWSWSLGATNNKGNISNAGAIFQGNRIYFFGDRTAINGDASIGFWFFKNGGVPLGVTDGAFSGSHTIGDLLIVSDFTNGGGVSTIKIYSWNGSGVTLVGTSTDARVNSSPIAVPTYTNPENGHSWSYLASNYPTGAFFEGFIDLTALGITDRCFTNFLLETRNSQTINASLQDFVAGAFDAKPRNPTAPNVTVCVGQPVSLNATCSNGNLISRCYSASSGGAPIGTGSPFVPTAPILGTYYVTCYNATLNCESDRVPVNVTVDPPVITNAGPDQTKCASSPAVTLAGSISGGATTGTWSGGAGTFNPNNTTLTAVYTPSAAEIAAGTVILTLTSANPAGPCDATSDTMVITINPAVITNAGPDQTKCSSSPAVTLAGSVSGGATTGTWSGGAGAFNPNNTTLTAVYTPSAAEIAAGTVTLTLTSANPAGPCDETSDTMVITINPAVITNAGPDQTKCASSPAVTLAGSVSGGATTGTWSGGAGTFNPNNTTLTAVYTPSAAEIAAGTVTLTLTSANPAGPCDATSDTMVITIYPAVITNAGPDQAKCASSPSVTLAGSVSGGATTGAWSGGTGTFSPNANALNAVYTPSAAEIPAAGAAPITVTLTLTSADPAGPCDATSDTMVITVNPLPAITCPLDSLFNLVTCGVTAAVAQTQANTAFATWFAGGPVSTPGFTVVPSFVYSSGAAPSPVGTAPIIPIIGSTPLANPTSVTVTWTITNTQTLCVNSCSATFRITYTCAISCNHLATPVLCKGASTGSITVNADAGTPPYAVYLYNPTNLYSSQTGLIPVSPITSITVLFANLPAGDYRYYVTDAANSVITLGCSTPLDPNTNLPEIITISEPAAALNLSALGHTNITCEGPNTGTITATFSGGTPPYQLKLDGGAAFAATSPYTFTGLIAGLHTVTAYDANYATSPLAGCTDQESVTVDPIVCGGHIFPTQTTCCNYVTGTVSELLNVCAKDNSGPSGIGPHVDVAVPGVFFYYSYVTAPSANFTIDLRQTKEANLNKFFKIQGYPSNPGQIRLTTENCSSVSFTASFIDSGAGARYVVTGATVGARYVVSVKYDTKSIQGGVYAGSPYDNTYTFKSYVGPSVTPLVLTADAASEGHVDAVSGCTDTTPLPPACPPAPAKAVSTAVSTNENVGFDVYPVPFKDLLTIRYNFDYKTDVKIVIFDMLGRVLMTYDDKEAYFGKEVALHPEFIQKAENMYFIKVFTNRGYETKKIISGK